MNEEVNSGWFLTFGFARFFRALFCFELIIEHGGEIANKQLDKTKQ